MKKLASYYTLTQKQLGSSKVLILEQ